MLFKQLDKLKRNVIMSSIVLMFIGNALMFISEDKVPFIGSALGFALLVVAALTIFDFLGSPKALVHYIRLALGLFSGLLGIMLLTIDSLFLQIVTWLAAVLPILFGVYGIYHALAFARRSGRRGWWILIVLSAAMAIFGGFIFQNPWADEPRAVLQVVGGIMMFSAFLSLIRLIWVWPLHREEEQ